MRLFWLIWNQHRCLRCLLDLLSRSGGTIVYLYAARALSRTGRIDAESLMLTTTSTRAVVTGLVIAELLRGATYLALPTIILAGAFAATVGAPLSVLCIPLAVTTLLASAGIVGYTLGLAGATLVSTSPFIARYKTLLELVSQCFSWVPSSR